MWDFKAADGLTLHPAFRVSEEGCVGCFLEPTRERDLGQHTVIELGQDPDQYK